MFGDCYRRDEIDASHYPVFHQAEGVRVWQRTASDVREGRLTLEWLVRDLQETLDGLVDHLFGAATPRRWLDDSFPFTSPSLQVEVQFQGRWMEVLGCGVIKPAICQHFSPAQSSTSSGDVGGVGAEVEVVGWAFGLGLERLAMVLFDIPDIRLFWSEDPRFIRQFIPHSHSHSGAPHTAPPLVASSSASASAPASLPFHSIKFTPFSKYPPTSRDLSVWLPHEGGTDMGEGTEDTAVENEAGAATRDRSEGGGDAMSVRFAATSRCLCCVPLE